PPGAGANRRGVRPHVRAGADGPRRDDLYRPRAALRRVPARGGLPLARTALRAAAQAGPVRRLVPPAARGRAARAAERGRSSAGRGDRIAGARRPRPLGGVPHPDVRLGVAAAVGLTIDLDRDERAIDHVAPTLREREAAPLLELGDRALGDEGVR